MIVTYNIFSGGIWYEKIIGLMIVVVLVFAFTACSDFGGSEDVKDIISDIIPESEIKVGASELVGEWVVTGSEINAQDEILSKTFELAQEMAYFEGAILEFESDGKCMLNGQVCTYVLVGNDEIEITNADGDITRTTYTVDGEKLTLDMYASQFVVYFSRVK